MSIKLTHDQIALCHVMLSCTTKSYFKLSTKEYDMIGAAYIHEVLPEQSTKTMMKIRRRFVKYLKESGSDYKTLVKNSDITYKK